MYMRGVWCAFWSRHWLFWLILCGLPWPLHANVSIVLQGRLWSLPSFIILLLKNHDNSWCYIGCAANSIIRTVLHAIMIWSILLQYVLCGGQLRSSIPCTTEARYLARQKLDTLHDRSRINLQNLMKLLAYLKNHPHCYTFWLFSQVLLAFIISLNLFVVHWLGPFVMRSTCRYCHGTRMYIKFPCAECEGKGSTVQRKKVTVPVPAGKKFVMHDVDCSV